MKSIFLKAVSVFCVLCVRSVVPATAFSASAAGVAPQFTGTVYLQNVATGKYLQSATATYTEDGVNIGKVKDTVGANVSVTAKQTKSQYASSVAQVFKIKKTGSNYFIQPANSTTKSIGVKDGKIADKQNVQLASGYSDKSSQWQFFKVSDGIYTIRNAANNKYALNARVNSTYVNADITPYSEGDKYQQWKIVKFSLAKDGDSPYNSTYGIDVSRWQGDINWQAVKEYGVSFAIISLGDGVTYSDEKFATNYSAAKSCGIKVGAYLYSRATTTAEAVAEANAALSTLGNNALDYPLFFDLEDESVQNLSKAEKTNICISFINTVEKAGYLSGVYASESWFSDHVNKDTLEKTGTALWIAQWPKGDNATVDHSEYDYWQFRSDGRIAGIDGYVDMDVNYQAPYTYKYRGTAFKPYDYNIYYGTKKLTRNTDYKITYSNNTAVGMGKAVITGIGNYSGVYSTYRKFFINKCSLSDGSVTLSGLKTSVRYSGEPVTQNLTLKTSAGYTLKSGTDYTVSYKNNNAVGTATVTISGKGNFSSKLTKTYTISDSLTDAKLGGVKDYAYTAKNITQSDLTVTLHGVKLTEGTDYTVTYKNNKNVGTASFTVVGKGMYSGSISKSFKINPRSLEEYTVNDLSDVTFTGSEVGVNDIKVIDAAGNELSKGTDFTLSYKKNVNTGTATVVITGKGNVTGSIERTFKIVSANISGAKLDAISWFGPDGKPETSLTVTFGGKVLTENKDYTVQYNHDSTAKKSTPVITGKGNFYGTNAIQVDIKRANIAVDTVNSVTKTAKTYNTKPQTQTVSISYLNETLKKDTDYTVTYKNNVNVGTATVVISGKGEYAGTVSCTFTIQPQKLSRAKISGIVNKTYNTKGQTQNATLTYNSSALVKNRDYTQSYKSNTASGVGYITFSGKGNYTGSVTKSFNIAKANISSATVGGIGTKRYNGSKQTQSLKITFKGKTLKNGTDYTLSYKNNKNVGTASVVISGKGNFNGKVTANFKINPQKTYITSLSPAKKTIKVNFAKRTTQASGYIVVYSTDKNFKNAKQIWVNSASKNSVTLTGLKAKTTYYVRVRTYFNNKSDKKRYYSDYCGTKSAKTTS